MTVKLYTKSMAMGVCFEVHPAEFATIRPTSLPQHDGLLTNTAGRLPSSSRLIKTAYGIAGHSTVLGLGVLHRVAPAESMPVQRCEVAAIIETGRRPCHWLIDTVKFCAFQGYRSCLLLLRDEMIRRRRPQAQHMVGSKLGTSLSTSPSQLLPTLSRVCSLTHRAWSLCLRRQEPTDAHRYRSRDEHR